MSPHLHAIDSKDSSKAQPSGCHACREGEAGFPIELTMAFQPIVNVVTREVYAYEALVRGLNGASASEVLSLVTAENRYAFDQACRVRAIGLAAELGIADRGARLAVNFMPGAVYSPAACIRRTLAAAREHSFPLDHIIFELTENEQIDSAHLQGISKEYSRHGFTLALDDFGSGYSGLNLLATLEGIGLVKLDGTLIRTAGTSRRAAAIISAMTRLCEDLGIDILAECVETPEEYDLLRDCGIHLMQGYFFARPAVAKLPSVYWPQPEQRPQAAITADSLMTVPQERVPAAAQQG